MPAFSSDRSAIFTRTVAVQTFYNGFPDFYALLATPSDSSADEIETAIVERGADLLAANFSRRGGSEMIRQIERYLPDFRPVLLDADNRRRYDDQLNRHKKRDANALPYAEWHSRLPAPKPPVPPARGLRARLRRALWENDYL